MERRRKSKARARQQKRGTKSVGKKPVYPHARIHTQRGEKEVEDDNNNNKDQCSSLPPSPVFYCPLIVLHALQRTIRR
jgi:hypothetical protein